MKRVRQAQIMFTESKKHKGLFEESDAALAVKFSEAGMGFEEGGRRLFHPLEAAYLVKIGESRFEKFASLEKFASAQAKKDKSFHFAFAVYASIRGAGRLIRPYAAKINFFRVYAPGVGRLDSRPSQLVCLLPGKVPSAKTLVEEVKIAHLARLDLIIACGTEKETKFYKISSFNF
jgi:tRNA splicing endonuclease